MKSEQKALTYTIIGSRPPRGCLHVLVLTARQKNKELMQNKEILLTKTAGISLCLLVPSAAVTPFPHVTL
jgi:hypothetical protein